MPKNKTDRFEQKIKELKRKIYEEKKSTQKIDDLIKEKIEREPGIWEYDFNELEKEIWNRYSSIKNKIKTVKTLSDEISQYSGRRPKDIFNFFKKLKVNLIKQSEINQEIIPLYLATMLSLQKVKDRLNSLEYKVDKINREKDDLVSEMEEYKAGLLRNKKKIDE
ncbi:MAG: hypothetical protein ACOC5G_02535 [Acidobacteriota bacterium]